MQLPSANRDRMHCLLANKKAVSWCNAQVLPWGGWVLSAPKGKVLVPWLGQLGSSGLSAEESDSEAFTVRDFVCVQCFRVTAAPGELSVRCGGWFSAVVCLKTLKSN